MPDVTGPVPPVQPDDPTPAEVEAPTTRLEDPAAAAENEALVAAYRGPAAVPAPARERATRVRATPRARRLAQEQGIDLAKVQAETGAEVIDETVLAPYLKP